jgi:DNA-binding response OmpR family regulator
MTVVLLAEDDEDITAVLVRVFGRAGLTVLRALDGAAAWEMIVAAPPDVVVTDIGVPNVDGRQLIEATRHRLFAAVERLAVLGRQHHARSTAVCLSLKTVAVR